MKLILFVTFSVLILVLPDIILNLLLYEDYRNGLFIVSKIALFVFTAGLASVLLRSFHWAYLLVGGVYLVSSLFEIINVWLLKQYLSMDNVKALFSTTANESLEFIDRFGAFLLLDVLVALAFLLCYIKYRRMTFAFGRRLAQVLVVSGLIAIAVPIMWVFDSEQRFAGRSLAKHILLQKIVKEHPLAFYYRSYEVGLYNSKYAALIENRKTYQFGATVGAARPRVVVLVIGEGMRYSNWSINGYERPTSPKLSQIANLISFHRHYSNANSTAASIPLILTQATPENASLAYSEKSILSLYKEAGYETAWIANQDIFYLDNREEADYAYDLFQERRADSTVLPVLDEVLAKTANGYKFIVVNLAGNHGDTPEAFTNTFKPNSGSQAASILPDNKSILINDYDSKILYQDYILSEIIRRVEGATTTALVMFTADHGVNLFDDANDVSLFGYGSSNPTQNELHIPLFLWLSDQYRQEHPGAVDALTANAESLSTNDNIFYTLADLSNIDYKFFDEHKSISSKEYRPDSRIQVLLNGERVFRNFPAH